MTEKSDAVILAGAGLAAILLLVAITGGRLKVTGPGGTGIEAVQVAGLAGEAVRVLKAESLRDFRRDSAPETNKVVETSPTVEEAVRRWEMLLGPKSEPSPWTKD